MNLPSLQAQARLQSNVKATETIAITIAAYFFSYVPAITYAEGGQTEESLTDSWFGFLAWYAIFFSSAVNPVIYYLRSSRFRSAFKQLLNDPFGSSKFKDKQSGRGTGREKINHVWVGTTKRNDNEDVSCFQTNGSQARQEYYGKRRNGMTILSIQMLQEHLYVLEGSKTNQDGRLNQRPKNEARRVISAALLHPVSAGLFPLAQLAIEARKTTEQKLPKVQRPCDPKTRQTGEKNEEVSEKRRVESESTRAQRKLSSGRMKSLQWAILVKLKILPNAKRIMQKFMRYWEAHKTP